MSIRDQEALEYHSTPTAGKISVVPTKPCRTQRDLSLAYTPGVAVPCLEIQRDPSLAYTYTAKGNLVAVISNGTAVLGLGNIGPLAGKPVMEGKGVLFKRFADIDVFDIELDTLDPKEVIRVCQILEPTFGGINLEDIKAPECFEIEEELKRTMKIPVFHDDQHGTAIISGAALVNALYLVGKKIEDVKIVFSGAGASAISCATFSAPTMTLSSRSYINSTGCPNSSHCSIMCRMRSASLFIASSVSSFDTTLLGNDQIFPSGIEPDPVARRPVRLRT